MGGFKSVDTAGVAETTLFADNVDFSGAANPTPKVLLDGQLLVGATALPHIRVNTLTAGSGITITNGPGTIEIAATAGPNPPVQTLTPDVGGAVSPVGNDIDVLGSPGASFPTDSILTHNFAAGQIGVENRRWQTAFIVDPSATIGARGTYATITAALAAASSGATIFVRPGTYTENFTLKAGVNICGWPSDGNSANYRQSEFTYNVKVIGKMSFSAAGQCCISNLFIQTNSDFCISVSGSNSSRVLFKNCYIYGSNNTAIEASNTNGAVSFYNCSGDLGTTGIAYFALSGGGGLTIDGGTWGNSGNSVTNSTWSAGPLTIRNCEFDSFLTSSGTTAVGNIYNVWFNNGGNNTTVLTHGSTSATQTSIWNCWFFSGTASAISVSASASLFLADCEIDSSNTNAITGSGSIELSNIVFTGTSSLINTTTQTYDYNQLGKWKASGQPAFFATQSGTLTNLTGDATTYTIVFDLEVFDQNSNFNTGTGVFTAPVTGRYHLQYNILAQQATTAMSITAALVTSNRSIYTSVGTAQAGNNMSTFSAVVDMDASDTASVTIQYSGGAKVVDIYGTSTADPRTNFSGVLVA